MMGSYMPGYVGPTMDVYGNGRPVWDQQTRATYPAEQLNTYENWLSQNRLVEGWDEFMKQSGGGTPNYNPPPGYFNPSQTALQQGNYTSPNFTLAGQGGGQASNVTGHGWGDNGIPGLYDYAVGPGGAISLVPGQTGPRQGYQGPISYLQPGGGWAQMSGQIPAGPGGGQMGGANPYSGQPMSQGGGPGGANPYGGQRFIPASHVGQYQTMNRGGGGGLGTSWGRPAQGGDPMPGGGGGMPGGGGGMVQPNRQFAGLGPGYDQSTGQPWQSWQSLGLNLGIPPGGGGGMSLAGPGGGGGGGVGPGGFPMLGQARQNPQQSGIVDWIDQARAGDQAAQYNLRGSYGWQQAAGGNVGGATDWLTRQGVDPKSAATMAGWVQANPNAWGGVNQASLYNTALGGFNQTNAARVAAGQPAQQWNPGI